MREVRVLQGAATTLLAVALGQAGFGSGLVGTLVDPPKSETLETIHGVGAYVVLVVTLVCVVAAVAVRRAGGPTWPAWSAALLLVLGVTQVRLGATEVVGPHVFVGVLLLCGVTTYVSYVWRQLPGPNRAGQTA